MDRPNQNFMPRHRPHGLVMREVEDEILIFDLESNHAHALTGLASRVWHLCDGRTELSEMARVLRATEGDEVNDDLLRLIVADLAERRLLHLPAAGTGRPVLTRREVVRTLAIASLAAPIIASVPVPAAAATSTCPGTTCGGGCKVAGDCGSLPNCNSCTGPAAGTCPASCCVPAGLTPPLSNCNLCCGGQGCSQNNTQC